MSVRLDYAIKLKKQRLWLELEPNLDNLEDHEVEYVIYARKSTDDDVNQKQSIPDQIRACIDYVTKHNEKQERKIKIMEKNELYNKHFKDELGDIKEARNLHISDKRFYEEIDNLFIIRESASAKKLGRPKRSALMKLVDSWKIKWILSYSPDRSARNMIDGWVLIERATEWKVKLLYTNFLFENSPSGRMMLWIWFTYSKFYSDNLSYVTKRWHTSASEKWKATGKVKHGYNIDEESKHYYPNEWYKLIREAFDMKLYTNKTNKEIADYICANWYYRELKTNKKKVYYDQWDIGNRRTDPFYYGMLTNGDVETRLPDKYDFIAMITEEEHYILIDKYLADKRWVRLQKDETDLQHVLDAFEKHCLKNPEGKTMTMYVSKKPLMEARIEKLKLSWEKFKYIDKVPKSYLRYKSSGSKHEVTYQELEPQIIARLKKIKVTPELYNKFGSAIHDEHKQRNEEIEQDIKTFTNRKNQLKREKKDYMNNAMASGIKDDEERELYNNKRKEYDELIAKIDSYLKDLEVEEELENIDYESFFLTLSNAHRYYIMSDMVRRRRILTILASNFSIDSQNVLTITPRKGLEVLFSPVNKKIRRQGFEPW